MRFRQLVAILGWTPNERLSATQRVDPNARYLKDHFPNFAVQPGVLMLESLYQAAMWLSLASDDFRRPLARMASSKAVKYSGLVLPGDTLEISVERTKAADPLFTYKGTAAVVDGDQRRGAVSARIQVELSQVADSIPNRAVTDVVLGREMRERFDALVASATCPEPENSL